MHIILPAYTGGRSFLTDVIITITGTHPKSQEERGTFSRSLFLRNVNHPDLTCQPMAEEVVLALSPLMTAYVVFGLNHGFLLAAAPARAHTMAYLKK